MDKNKNQYDSESHIYWTVGEGYSENEIIFESERKISDKVSEVFMFSLGDVVMYSCVFKLIAFFILIMGIERIIDYFVKNKTNKYYNFIFLFSIISLVSDIMLIGFFKVQNKY